MEDAESIATIVIALATASALWAAGMRTVTIVVAFATAMVIHALYPNGALGLVTDALRPVAALTRH